MSAVEDGKMSGKSERRRHRRWPLRMPVRVQGREADGSILEEMTSCEDASTRGACLRLRHAVRQGQVLHLSLPLPSRFRQYDVTAQSYRVYALVRSVTPTPGDRARVGVLFYGRNPPRGTESLPAGLFLIEGDSRPGSRDPEHGIDVVLRLALSHAPGGMAHEELTRTEHVTAWGARVRIRSLPVMKGMIVGLEEVGGGFVTQAEVGQILIGADGHPRIDLVFLDRPAPEGWGAPRTGS